MIVADTSLYDSWKGTTVEPDEHSLLQLKLLIVAPLIVMFCFKLSPSRIYPSSAVSFTSAIYNLSSNLSVSESFLVLSFPISHSTEVLYPVPVLPVKSGDAPTTGSVMVMSAAVTGIPTRTIYFSLAGFITYFLYYLPTA